MLENVRNKMLLNRRDPQRDTLGWECPAEFSTPSPYTHIPTK